MRTRRDQRRPAVDVVHGAFCEECACALRMLVRLLELADVDQGRGEIHLGSSGCLVLPELLRESERLLAEGPRRRVIGAHRVHAAQSRHGAQTHRWKLEAFGDRACPRERSKSLLVAPAVDRGQGSAELQEKRYLALKTVRGLGLRLQELESRLKVEANLPIGHAQAGLVGGLPVVADRALGVAAAIE